MRMNRACTRGSETVVVGMEPVPCATGGCQVVPSIEVWTLTGPGGRGRGGRGAGPPAVAPVGYSVQTSMDGTTWQPPVAQGTGSLPTTTVSLPRVQARFIRINQTGTAQNGEGWGIQQVRVLTVR